MTGGHATVMDLYEACCQQPRAMADALQRLHGGAPRVLHEDFCGSAAVARAWCAAGGARRAVGVDLDAGTIDAARARAVPGMDLVVGSVLDHDMPASGADVVFAGNFSVGELRSRAELTRYIAGCLRRLAPDGVLVCDLFGSAPNAVGGSLRRTVVLPDGRTVDYTWEQRSWNPWSAEVECAIHFRVRQGGEVVASHPDAFVYRWRVWGVAEFRDALAEGGFTSTAVVDPFAAAGAAPAGAGAVCVVARRGHAATTRA